MNERTWVDALSRPCPVPDGTRIAMVFMPNDPDPIPPGTLGTVTGGNGAQMYVDWDNGRSLMIAVGVDRWRVIPPVEAEIRRRLDGGRDA